MLAEAKQSLFWIVCAVCSSPVSSMAKGVHLSKVAYTCILDASVYHKVNADVLQAIVRHESRGRAESVTRNSNGTVDVGLTGINSIHFPDLMKKGVPSSLLTNECVSIYVGAWKLSQSMFKYKNSWKAVGAYHSSTPFYNYRYQTLIHNELVDMGSMPPPKILVPSLSQTSAH